MRRALLLLSEKKSVGGRGGATVWVLRPRCSAANGGTRLRRLLCRRRGGTSLGLAGGGGGKDFSHGGLGGAAQKPQGQPTTEGAWWQGLREEAVGTQVMCSGALLSECVTQL